MGMPFHLIAKRHRLLGEWERARASKDSDAIKRAEQAIRKWDWRKE
jgi:hypothetical protein